MSFEVTNWSEEAREAVAAALEQLARRLRTEPVDGAYVFHRDAWSIDVEVRFRRPKPYATSDSASAEHTK